MKAAVNYGKCVSLKMVENCQHMLAVIT